MPRARLRLCPKRRQALLAGTVLLGLLAGATRVAAKASVPLKPVEVERLGGRLRISVGFRELFDAELRQRLDSGFVMTVAQTLALHVTSDARPIVVLQRTLRAVYDLWDEQYLVTIADSAGERRLRLRQQREVVDVLTSWWRYPLAAPTTTAPATGYFFTGLAQVNPISDQALSQVRRWLRRPPYRKQRSGGGESFFGSFVSIFVNARIAQAERSYVFRTPAFSLGD